MSFKHPEYLWTLLVLVIPVLVHLFNLRKFVPVKFTNVAFIKAIVSKNRKSSTIKKWIALLLRLLAFTCIIIAFAQPRRFVLQKGQDNQLVVYLDNSFSMEAKAEGGKLLERCVQDLIQALPKQKRLTLFTNDNTFVNYRGSDLENLLLTLDYSSKALEFRDIIIKAQSLFSAKANIPKKLLVISDLKNFGIIDEKTLDFDMEVVSLSSNNENTAILEAQLENLNAEGLVLKVSLQSDFQEISIPVALYENETLLNKAQANITNNKGSVRFLLPNKKLLQGKIMIEDQGLSFDNSLFFIVQEPNPIKVLCIGEVTDDFLKKIYGESHIEYLSVSKDNFDYDLIAAQDLVILNEVSDLHKGLEVALRNFMEAGEHLAIIPNKNSNLQAYNSLLKDYAHLQNESSSKIRISNIHFSHPLYKGVFTEQTSNFRYPEVQSSFKINSSINPVLSFENGRPFLVSNKSLSLFSAAINLSNSSFQNSPLIVPTLYNMSKQSFLQPTLYYTIGKENSFDIKTPLAVDEVLDISNGENKFIPLQQKISEKVRVFTDENPSKAGIYTISHKEKSIGDVCYNYNRSESFGQASPVGDTVDLLEDIEEAISDSVNLGREDTLWKWFVIFALVFALTEMLVLSKKLS